MKEASAYIKCSLIDFYINLTLNKLAIPMVSLALSHTHTHTHTQTHTHTHTVGMRAHTHFIHFGHQYSC